MIGVFIAGGILFYLYIRPRARRDQPVLAHHSEFAHESVDDIAQAKYGENARSKPITTPTVPSGVNIHRLNNAPRRTAVHVNKGTLLDL